MIIATAGHVDHGKTLLVKGLTGIDADRLPEEKLRGMTIDLGFAYMPTTFGPPIGFIDVPGHERFVRNMLCGVSGIDFVLFIIAADDGPKPQTQEHLSILDLLGVDRGAIVLSKVDRVSLERRLEVERQIADLVAGTTLSDAPIFGVSALTGAGVDSLRAYILEAASKLQPRVPKGRFRLSVDRCFNVTGTGLVVTGTAIAGTVAVGEQVKVLSAGLDARVRAIRAQSVNAELGRAGERCALNLVGAGLEKDRISRGDWIVGGDPPPLARKIDARIRVLPSEPGALAHWTPIHLHIGATETTGRIAILGASAIPPGESGLVQIVLDRPICASYGDRIIVRDQSAKRTIGGGRVVDIFAPSRGRASAARLAELAVLDNVDDRAVLKGSLERGDNGVDLSRFVISRNLTTTEAKAIFAETPMIRVESGSMGFGFALARWNVLKDLALDALARWHRRSPDTVGPSEDRIFHGTAIRLPREASIAVARELIKQGLIARDGMGIRLHTHQPTLDPGVAVLWRRIAPLLEENALRPPSVAEIATTLRLDPKKIDSVLVHVSRHGLAIRVSKTRFYLPGGLRRLAELAAEVASANPQRIITAASFRDHSTIGRNVSIEVLEFFDRVKITRRVGDGHVILRSAADAFGDNLKLSKV